MTKDSLHEHIASSNPVARFEQLALSPGDGLVEARNSLRHWLFEKAGDLASTGSIGDALALIARDAHPDRTAALVVVRLLAIQGLIPEPNSANHIVRSVVAIVEAALPDLVAFLKFNPRSQNYEKYGQISLTHQKVGQLLNPVADRFGDLEALLAARKEIIGALNHSVVRGYCEPFRLNDIRNAIEAVFSRLKRIATPEASFLTDYEECVRSISDARLAGQENGSFLAVDYLNPFLTNVAIVIEDYLASVRARFQTAVRWPRATKELQKRYPLHEEGRAFPVLIPLRNDGPGLATDVRISTTISGDDVYIPSQTLSLGNVLPGDFSVVLEAMVIRPTERFDGIIHVEWGEIGSPARDSDVFEFTVMSQASDVDWNSIQFWTPYSTDVAKGDAFIGRDEKVRLLASKLLRNPMEPFYVTGQKRVGKTSLALAAAAFATQHEAGQNIFYHYILWGDVAHFEPKDCIKQLGQSIERFIKSKFPNGFTFEPGDYDGSLAPIVELSSIASTVLPNTKFVVIIDEFDEIPQELFLHGNLADTFFGNLRAISRRENICLCLVGGENMPFVFDRQGQRVNNFSRINLSYFSRESEWGDFQKMIREPSAGVLNWHDDGIAEVFNATNGNPYYGKIVCAGVLRRAVAERDADITVTEVRSAAEAEVSALGTNSFAHLWQDGVPRSAEEREPDILRRSRVLVAAARCLREPVPLTASNIAERKASSELTESEISPVLNDFVRREVLREKSGVYEFVLPIFGKWLADVGANQLVADRLSDELSQSAIQQENAVVVRAEEVVDLVKGWPTYRGRQIGTDDVRAWYQQVASPREQRLLFKLLKRTTVFSETLVRERLRSAHAIIRSVIPVPITRKKNERRTDIAITDVDGEGKSGVSYASLYAEENGIAVSNIIPPSDFKKKFAKLRKDVEVISALVIIDDIAATGASLRDNIANFVADHSGELVDIKVRGVCLVATEEAQRRILRGISKIEQIDVDFRACEILPPSSFAFPDDGSGWDDDDERERALAMCNQLGGKIYKQSPLGFGGQGLLVVFPTTTPNNSLPILHSHSRIGAGTTWSPLFPRVVN